MRVAILTDGSFPSATVWSGRLRTHPRVSDLHVCDARDPSRGDRLRAWNPHLVIRLGDAGTELEPVPALGVVTLTGHGEPTHAREVAVGALTVRAQWHGPSGAEPSLLAEARAPVYAHDDVRALRSRAEELASHVLEDGLTRLAEDPETPGIATAHDHGASIKTLAARVGNQIPGWPNSRRPRRLWQWGKGALVRVLDAVVLPIRDAWRTLRRTHPVRVFTFHRVTHLCRDGMTVSPDVFRRQVDRIRKTHAVVPLSKALQLLREGPRLRRPVASITFDDGYRSVLEHAKPILDDAGLAACCFVSTDYVGTEGRFEHDHDSPVVPYLGVMDWNGLKALMADGWEIGGHTCSHARMSELDPDSTRAELSGAFAALRDRLGIDAVPMAYPFGGPGDIEPWQVELVREAGYSALFSDFGGVNRGGHDPFRLRRIELGGDHDAASWRLRVRGMSLDAFRRDPERPAESWRDRLERALG